MRILLTNDDGIHAEGLVVLERIAAALSDDVWVVAPEQEQSGASHSLTLHVPVRVRQLGEKRFAVSGTPTDCVLLAVQEILPNALGLRGKEAFRSSSEAVAHQTFDIVLSGVNRGGNAADDITYSGTVAGAMEATQLGIPAFALSQFITNPESICWETAEAFAPRIIETLIAKGFPKGTLMNLNFPAFLPADVRGVALCPQGKRHMSVGFSKRADPRERPYYWIGGDRDDATDRDDVDIARLTQGFVTVTPVQMDLTDYATLENFKGLFSV